MFCPKCGKETDALGKYCQWCGADNVSAPATPVAAPEEEECPDVGVYAGLGRRFVAWIVDTLLILLIGTIVISFFSLINGVRYAYYLLVQRAPIDALTEAGTVDAAVFPIITSLGILLIIVPWLYYAGFESSRSQATPGKLLMNIMVTDMDGNKPTFARATLRQFAKIISALIFFLGFLMIGLTEKRQGLHDKIAGCLVLLQE